MSTLETALDGCLEALASGEMTLEECLVRYPEHALELRPLLLAAVRVSDSPAIAPSPQFRARAREQLVAHMRAHPQPVSPRAVLARSSFASRARGLAGALASAVLVLAVAGTAAAQWALPGHALYGWKRASESAWVSLQPGPQLKLETQLAIAARRLAEAEAVAGDPARVTTALEGYAASIAAIQSLTAEHPDLQAEVDAALARQSERLNDLRDEGLTIPPNETLPTPPSLTPTGAVPTLLVVPTGVVPIPTGVLPTGVVPALTPIAPAPSDASGLPLLTPPAVAP